VAGHIQLSVSPPNLPMADGGAPTRRTSVKTDRHIGNIGFHRQRFDCCFKTSAVGASFSMLRMFSAMRAASASPRGGLYRQRRGQIHLPCGRESERPIRVGQFFLIRHGPETVGQVVVFERAVRLYCVVTTMVIGNYQSLPEISSPVQPLPNRTTASFILAWFTL
jgi:hypothetical protein